MLGLRETEGRLSLNPMTRDTPGSARESTHWTARDGTIDPAQAFYVVEHPHIPGQVEEIWVLKAQPEPSGKWCL